MPVVFDAVAGRAAGVVERSRPQRDAGPGMQGVAGMEVAEFELSSQRFDLEREQRKAHQLAHRLLDAAGGLQIAGPDADDLAFDEHRREERQPDDVVDVAVTEENVEAVRVRSRRQHLAEGADAGAGIEDENVLAAADLHAGRVAAVA